MTSTIQFNAMNNQISEPTQMFLLDTALNFIQISTIFKKIYLNDIHDTTSDILFILSHFLKPK